MLLPEKVKSMDLVEYPHGLYLVEALAKRDDLPVDELLEHLEDGENFFRYDELYMTNLAGELQLEEAIPVLLKKLRLDADLICEEAGDALIKIGTDHVMVKQLIDQDAYNSTIMDLRRPLYASCRMLQVNLDELEQWNKEFHDHDRAIEERIKAMDMLPSSLTAVDGGQMQKEESRKIGRNEPCPCGSGKKYKKCCGRS